MGKLVAGVGYNSEKIPTGYTDANGKWHICRIYSKWFNMIQRCYAVNHVAYKAYGAVGVTVCKDWHDFAEYYNWTRAQFKPNPIQSSTGSKSLRNPQADKDGMGDSKTYSPDTCLYISHRLNTFLVNHSDTEKGLLLGVGYLGKQNYTNTFQARLVGAYNKAGCYPTEVEAHLASMQGRITQYKEVFDKELARCIADGADQEYVDKFNTMIKYQIGKLEDKVKVAQERISNGDYGMTTEQALSCNGSWPKLLSKQQS